jgi:hypothetical protein
MVRIISISSISLVLRSALLRASRRTATNEIVPAAILRDGRPRGRPLQDEVRGFEFGRSIRLVSWNRSTSRGQPPSTKVEKIADKSVLWKPCGASGNKRASFEHNRSIHGDNFRRDLARISAFGVLWNSDRPARFFSAVSASWRQWLGSGGCRCLVTDLDLPTGNPHAMGVFPSIPTLALKRRSW